MPRGGVDLDAVHEGRSGPPTIYDEVEQRIRTGMPAEELEFVGVDADIARRQPMAVYDARKATGAAETRDVFTGLFAALLRKGRAGRGGHSGSSRVSAPP